MFEHGLVNAIVLARQVNGVIVDQAGWDRTFEAPFKKATSELARRVVCYGGLDAAELTLLQTRSPNGTGLRIGSSEITSRARCLLAA